MSVSASRTPDTSLRLSRFATRGGDRLYSIEVDAFPALTVNLFLAVVGDPAQPKYTALIDFGSERRGCFQQLQEGVAAIREQYGERVSLEHLDRLILTHAHPDHVSGLPQVRAAAPHTPLAAYADARDTLEDPNGAACRSEAALREVFAWQGVAPDTIEAWLKQAARALLPTPMPADLYLDHGESLDGQFEVMHVPGHAADQMALRFGDLLLTADHILPDNLPPLWPTRLRAGLGIKPYLVGLARVTAECGNVAGEKNGGLSLLVPSHGAAIEHPMERIEEVRARLTEKSQKLYHLIEERPDLTFSELTEARYPDLHAQRRRLMLNQVTALGEYMHGRGLLLESVEVETGAARWQVNPAVEPTVG